MQIYTLMQRDSYPRFLASETYKRLLQWLETKTCRRAIAGIKSLSHRLTTSHSTVGCWEWRREIRHIDAFQEWNARWNCADAEPLQHCRGLFYWSKPEPNIKHVWPRQHDISVTIERPFYIYLFTLNLKTPLLVDKKYSDDLLFFFCPITDNSVEKSDVHQIIKSEQLYFCNKASLNVTEISSLSFFAPDAQLSDDLTFPFLCADGQGLPGTLHTPLLFSHSVSNHLIFRAQWFPSALSSFRCCPSNSITVFLIMSSCRRFCLQWCGRRGSGPSDRSTAASIFYDCLQAVALPREGKGKGLALV